MGRPAFPRRSDAAKSVIGAEGYLPIEAHRGKRGDKEVWVIFCLWEYATDPKDLAPAIPDPVKDKAAKPAPTATLVKPGWLELAHIRMFTYDLKTGELIGFVTCD